MEDQTASPFLSIIIPAYNEEQRLPHTLDETIAFLKGQDYSSEVLVIENGSSDNTLAVARAYAERFPIVKALQCPQRGKGVAVRLGMLQAVGQYRFMCDADLSMPIQEIQRFLPPVLEDFDIAIASREAPGAVRYDEPAYRHLVGRGYNALIRLMALPGLHDTQCGFKCFRAQVAEDLFPRQTLLGWSFDVEVLFIARLQKYRIVEIPISWRFNADSKIRVLHDSFKMGVDLLKIRLNALQGVYSKR